MNIFKPLHALICQSVGHIFSTPLTQDAFQKVTLEPSRDSKHGELATNIAMVLAKPLQKKPQEVAAQLCEYLKNQSPIVQADVAGPGFINLTLSSEFWRNHIGEILKAKESYGGSNLGQGEAVNVEFVSVNPTGPLHAGHGRNAVFGDAVASLLQKVGYDVTREYYINDAGGQVNALADSVYLRYKEALGHAISSDDFTADMYGGDYLIPVGQQLAKECQDQWLNQDRKNWLPFFRKYSVDAMMVAIREDLASMGVEMDVYTSEEKLVADGLVDKALQVLDDAGHIYVGVLTPPKGHVVEDWEERPQTLFRSTNFGDTLDRALKKSDGSWTYFAGDIAYHLNKFQRGFRRMVNILSADHAGYVKRIHAAVRAITHDQAIIDIKVYQMVNFLDQGQPVRMSKRAGTFVTMCDVIDRVGKDPTRFMMVSRHADMPIDFDFAKVLEQSRDNPIFYIQYAHARICSVLRHAAATFSDFDMNKLDQVSLDTLTDSHEFAMMRIVSEWPKQVETAALCGEPHRIATYLYDVASEFHALWNKGKENTQLRFIHVESKEQTNAKLALILAVKHVIASGLAVFGITPIEEMR